MIFFVSHVILFLSQNILCETLCHTLCNSVVNVFSKSLFLTQSFTEFLSQSCTESTNHKTKKHKFNNLTKTEPLFPYFCPRLIRNARRTIQEQQGS